MNRVNIRYEPDKICSEMWDNFHEIISVEIRKMLDWRIEEIIYSLKAELDDLIYLEIRYTDVW